MLPLLVRCNTLNDITDGTHKFYAMVGILQVVGHAAIGLLAGLVGPKPVLVGQGVKLHQTSGQVRNHRAFVMLVKIGLQPVNQSVEIQCVQGRMNLRVRLGIGQGRA